ncbi:51fddffd-06bf-42b5-aef0-8fd831e80ff1 [Sclerotinia trifoliorum]|uniref:51fddffd-06bf-42b5-aef0-8fd831e80ff1 n=1 Tax=Sclerotinia trifoliorum TaxID=28548 RepID=A0A8H2VZY3_9HELO|nr:51fddffd-06bf-42b5-aef0-8fd831e80ff1 [Sclerotinia trifoliorum]
MDVFGSAIVLVLIVFLLPRKFPYHGSSTPPINVHWRSFLKRVDFMGALLLLSASVLLITALLEVPTVFSWSSAAMICLLTISVFLWIGFVVWEWFVGSSKGVQELMFPQVLLDNRIWMGVALTSFLVGIPSQIITMRSLKKHRLYTETPRGKPDID